MDSKMPEFFNFHISDITKTDEKWNLSLTEPGKTKPVSDIYEGRDPTESYISFPTINYRGYNIFDSNNENKKILEIYTSDIIYLFIAYEETTDKLRVALMKHFEKRGKY